MPFNLTAFDDLGRRRFLTLGAGATAIAGMQLVPAFARAAYRSNAHGLSVSSYASDPKDVDWVNTHWIETADGFIVIDVQRLLPEAERAVRLIERTNKPILGIFVTHPHTDHYGGLSVFRAAAPEAPVYAAETTIGVMRDDSNGFNARRKKRHGDRFPSQKVIAGHLPTETVSSGDIVTLGGLRLEVFETAASHAESSLLIHALDHSVIFTGDIVTNRLIPAPFVSLETWLAQLDEIERRIPPGTLTYPGFGPPSGLSGLVEQQREYLVVLRDLVRTGLDGASEISDATKAEIAFELAARFPFHFPGGGNTRERVLGFVIDLVVRQQLAGDTAVEPFRT